MEGDVSWLTCHVIFLGSDLHLGFVDILDYSCAVDRAKWMYMSVPEIISFNIIITILLWFLPEVSSCKFGFSQRESSLPHHLTHLSLSLKMRRKLWWWRLSGFEVWRLLLWRLIVRYKYILQSVVTDFQLTSMILRRIWRKRMERASDFFLSRLRPVWAPFRRAFMMVWALQSQTTNDDLNLPGHDASRLFQRPPGILCPTHLWTASWLTPLALVLSVLFPGHCDEEKSCCLCYSKHILFPSVYR